ncbi:MAG: hypothetical protein JWP89_6339 [Schlesneria sp.]|nr:hypothetical protein [Schlesneria sp.]
MKQVTRSIPYFTFLSNSCEVFVGSGKLSVRWVDLARSLSEVGDIRKDRARRLEHYEMAEFVSPWQGFGGVCDFVTRCLARF